MQHDELIKISVVVPTLDEEVNLPLLYESIMRQELSNNIVIADIIAVDNGSTDNTVAISKSYCTNVFVRPDDSIADLRNCGARHSSGDILIFLDADCILGKDVIETVASLLWNNQPTAVGPDGLIPVADSTWVQTTWYLHTKLLNYYNQNVEVDNLSSGFFAIKRSGYEMVGGFDGSLTIGEDTDISRKLRLQGFVLIRSNKLLVYNSGHPKTVKEIIKREYWHGDSILHLLIHKSLELLTIYFIANAIAIILSVILSIYYRSVVLFVVVLAALCVMPFIKAVKKTGRINRNSFLLFTIYLLYVFSRSAALFKMNQKGHSE